MGWEEQTEKGEQGGENGVCVGEEGLIGSWFLRMGHAEQEQKQCDGEGCVCRGEGGGCRGGGGV